MKNLSLASLGALFPAAMYARIIYPRSFSAGVFLVGAVAAASGSYLFVDRVDSTPDAPYVVSERLQEPVVVADGPRAPLALETLQAAAQPTSKERLFTPSVSQDRTVISQVSRVFIGRPSVVPPQRPVASAEVQPVEMAAMARPRQRPDGLGNSEPAGQLAAVLRPQQRPRGLEVAKVAKTQGNSAPAASERVAQAKPEQPADPAPRTSVGTAVTDNVMRAGNCPSYLARAIPRRSGNATSVNTLLASVKSTDGVKRDQVLEREIRKGNMPSFLRDLVPVGITGRASDGSAVRIVLCVMPDYLAVGNDRDYVRVPLGLNAAKRISDDFDMILPTTRMVDLIYRASDVRLTPNPMKPGASMTSTAYFQTHNETVESQLRQVGASGGALVSGHKKDLVLTRRLSTKQGRVAIYGWHRRNGKPIQPLSTVHGAGYADYSHGVRLVSRTAFLNGQKIDLRSLMSDPRFADLLNNEGPLGTQILASN